MKVNLDKSNYRRNVWSVLFRKVYLCEKMLKLNKEKGWPVPPPLQVKASE